MLRPRTPTATMLAYIERHIDYDSDTGILTWKNLNTYQARRAGKGKRAGYPNGDGYWVLKVPDEHGAHTVFQHHVAWWFIHGVWPPRCVDHRDRHRDNNAIANLRLNTKHIERVNRSLSRNSESGVRGVCKNSHGNRYTAYITFENRRHYLGNYKSIEEAKIARVAAERILFGEITPTNRAA